MMMGINILNIPINKKPFCASLRFAAPNALCTITWFIHQKYTWLTTNPVNKVPKGKTESLLPIELNFSGAC